MRTCNVCGCYLPDKWNICPACHSPDRKEIGNNYTVFQVKVMNEHKIIDREFFGIYSNACNYAKRKVQETGVSHTEIVKNGVILNYLSKQPTD